MAAEMVGMVGSALAQEGVTGVSSYISSKLDETASRAHLMARLEMALSQLEFALERTGELPITYVSLLRRMKMLKRAYAEGTDLLNKHRRPQQRELEDGGGVDLGRPPPVTSVTRRHPFLAWVGRARNRLLPAASSSLLGLMTNKADHLSSSVVQTFEWYAACADRFAADAESAGLPLRRDAAVRYPLVRRLLEGKTLRYETAARGSRRRQLHSLVVWPVRLEERGVEARLLYQYLDRERPERRFRLRLVLRLSEATDIVGIAIRCLQAVSAQFKLAVTECAMGELALLPDHLQDISHSYGPPLDWSEESYAAITKAWRPDPICCCANNDGKGVSPSPHGVPEPVIAVGFGCYVSAPELTASSLHGGGSASAAAGGNEDYHHAPPLYMVASFVPHHTCAAGAPRGLVLTYGGRDECVGGGSIQQVEEAVRSTAIGSVVRQPEPADYDVSLYAMHGFARITLRKASDELAWAKRAAAPTPGRGRSAAKRKR